MADFGLTKESVKGLGPGAYLVNVLPSAVLVLGILALVSSHLYPWAEPATKDGKPVPAGLSSITVELRGLGVAGGVILALAVLLAAVMLRPFQISAVQVLEGYWRKRPLAGVPHAMAVERHVRRRSLQRLRVLVSEPTELSLPVAHFDAVARQIRRTERASRQATEAEEVLAQYPTRVSSFMPTLLGNILRRAESTAGERYGLVTITSYTRLYPHLSVKLNQEIETQFNLIDTACTLAIVNAVLASASTPLIFRWDGWSLVPLALVLASMVSYRGARIAAGRHGETLAAAFDLHRFDLLRALHRPLPADAVEEFEDNLALSRVLGGERPCDVGGPAWRYVHPPEAETGVPPISATSSPPAADGADSGSKSAGDSTGDSDGPVGTDDETGPRDEPPSAG